VDVITTTITSCGWSRSTSTWRMLAVPGAGAVTTPRRLVTWETTSASRRSAASTSRRISPRASAAEIGSESAPVGGSVAISST
jgi:hypothetical protein